MDWKEDITLVSKYGEIFVINVFHIALAFSGFRYIELSIQKRTDDHPLNLKPINYKAEHYKKLMKGKVKQEDMNERITTNVANGL